MRGTDRLRQRLRCTALAGLFKLLLELSGLVANAAFRRDHQRSRLLLQGLCYRCGRLLLAVLSTDEEVRVRQPRVVTVLFQLLSALWG